MREDRPKVCTVEFLVDTCNRMNLDFIDSRLEGARRIIRISPHGGGGVKSIASIGDQERAVPPSWQFPDACALESTTGFWQSIVVPELERKMESQTIASSLRKSKPDFNPDPMAQLRAGGEETMAAYPDGARLRHYGQEASRKKDPVCQSSGNPLRWGYNSHEGCRSADCIHVHEPMMQSGIHWGVSMQFLALWDYLAIRLSIRIRLNDICMLSGSITLFLCPKMTPSPAPTTVQFLEIYRSPAHALILRLRMMT